MPDLRRYHRQILLPGLGERGQRRLLDSHALIIGCGALGSMIVDALARAGIGTLTIIDRDTVELTNLQRQVLFDEADVAQTMPKAEAARAKIARINSQIVVHAHVDDLNHRNAERYVEGADLILDGLDNFETRYLLNDLSVKHGLPYVYGGAVATGGMSMPILPHPLGRTQSSVTWAQEQSTPCLRCVFPDAPPPGASQTCDTAGVLGPAASMIAAHQVTQAVKLLTGNLDVLDRSLVSIDVWTNQTRRFDVSGARTTEGPSACPCCVSGRLEFLEGRAASATTSLCGRNAVQITPADETAHARGLDLAGLAARLAAHGSFSHNGYLLHGRFATERTGEDEPVELTIFPDGRAIIKGTTEPETARSIYAKYVGA
ncbi:MAG: ThiF family adenylyltransferase [Planctomycetota bacterium]|jgi:adenylyltransferase/sulfurtransferase